MMGEREPQTPLWNYRVNLDKRVRRDHPLRRINEVLDLRFVGALPTLLTVTVSNWLGGAHSGSRPSKICSLPQCRTCENWSGTSAKLTHS